MANTQVKAVINAIKKQYNILGRDIAASIGLSANHLSNLCTGRYPLTAVYRDRLAEKYPDCADRIRTLPVVEPTQRESPASKPLYTAFRRELEGMISLAREYTRTNDARFSQQEENQRSLIEQNRLLIESSAQMLKIQEELIQKSVTDSEMNRRMQAGQERLISSVVETMQAQTDILRRLADRLFGDDAAAK
jgi:vancomycin resistance protein YoaR